MAQYLSSIMNHKKNSINFNSIFFTQIYYNFIKKRNLDFDKNVIIFNLSELFTTVKKTAYIPYFRNNLNC